MKPPLEITLTFSNRFDEKTTVAITGDNKEAWISIREDEDDDHKEKSIMLDPQEIDVLISALNLFKYRILNSNRGCNDED